MIAAPAVGRVVSIERVARSLDLSPATIRKMSRNGDFPPALDLKVRKTKFLSALIEEWWATRLGGVNGHPFPWAAEDPDDEGRRGRDGADLVIPTPQVSTIRACGGLGSPRPGPPRAHMGGQLRNGRSVCRDGRGNCRGRQLAGRSRGA